MTDPEAIAHAITSDSSNLAQSIYDALFAETSHDGDPYMSGDADLHNVTIDGRFDLVATARTLRSLTAASYAKYTKHFREE